jgi:hypothetical protein
MNALIEKYVGESFCKHFSYSQVLFWDESDKRCLQNFMVPKRRFWTAEQSVACDFEVLFKGVSTLFGLQLFENSFKNAYATAVGN